MKKMNVAETFGESPFARAKMKEAK